MCCNRKRWSFRTVAIRTSIEMTVPIPAKTMLSSRYLFWFVPYDWPTSSVGKFQRLFQWSPIQMSESWVFHQTIALIKVGCCTMLKCHPGNAKGLLYSQFRRSTMHSSIDDKNDSVLPSNRPQNVFLREHETEDMTCAPSLQNKTKTVMRFFHWRHLSISRILNSLRLSLHCILHFQRDWREKWSWCGRIPIAS